MPSLLIQTALAAEARPLLDAMCWKLVDRGRGGTLYAATKRPWKLLVSGTGVIAASAATAATLARFPEISYALNFGCAGAPTALAAIGDARWIHRLTDAASGRSYHPDILYRHPWREAALTTHGRVQSDPRAAATLVDMEGTGFFGAACRCLPVHRLHLLKVVVDHLDDRRLEPTALAELLRPVVPALLDYLGEVPPPRPPARLSAARKAQAGALREAWRLSETQHQQLLKTLLGAELRGQAVDPLLARALAAPPIDKNQRNARWKDLRHELAQTV